MDFAKLNDKLDELGDIYLCLTDFKWRAIKDLRADIEQLKATKDRSAWSVDDKLTMLALELSEQRLRHSALVQLLIANKAVAADQLAGLILESRSEGD